MYCSIPGFPVQSPTSRAYPNSCPSNWWCHPTIPSSVIPFSSCLQSFPASGSFPMSWIVTSGSQSIWSSSFSIRPSSEYSGVIALRTDTGLCVFVSASLPVCPPPLIMFWCCEPPLVTDQLPPASNYPTRFWSWAHPAVSSWWPTALFWHFSCVCEGDENQELWKSIQLILNFKK